MKITRKKIKENKLQLKPIVTSPIFRNVVTVELVIELSDYVLCMDLMIKCTILLINVIVYGYRLIVNLNKAVKLLTFVNEKFCSEMLTTRSLIRIDMVKERIIN